MHQMNRLSEQTENIYNHPLAVSNAVLRINANIVKIHREMKDIALSYDVESINAHAQTADSLEAEVFEDFTIIDKQFLGKKEEYEKSWMFLQYGSRFAMKLFH
jgi:methyl-accepting chemotaxis protein